MWKPKARITISKGFTLSSGYGDYYVEHRGEMIGHVDPSYYQTRKDVMAEAREVVRAYKAKGESRVNPKSPLKRVRKALKKYVRKALGKKNPRRDYQVHVPAANGDRGYEIKVKAPTASSALAAARKYCAGRAGKSVRGFHLPRGTKARVV